MMEAGKTGKLGKRLPCEHEDPQNKESSYAWPLVRVRLHPWNRQNTLVLSDPRGSRKSLRAMVILLACGLFQKMTSHR